MTDPIVRLHDIVERIDLALGFVEGLSLEQFQSDRKTQEAVLRQIQVVGQAAGQIPEELRIKYAAVPWRQAIDMRNLITHEYWRIQSEVVWATVQNDLPALRRQITLILNEQIGPAEV